MIADIALLIGAYLIGSFPYMLLLGRAKGIDLTQEYDSHQALWSKVGRLAGLSGVIVDILKGVIAVLIGFFLEFRLAMVAAAGVAALIGQMWPVFQKFDGEKGNTTSGGVILGMTMWLTGHGSPLAYWVFIITIIPALIGFLVRTIPRFVARGQTMNDRFMLGGPASNSLPLGMLLAFAAAPLASWLLNQPLEMTLGFVALFVLIVLRRLTADLRADLKPDASMRSILINRFLYDRSYL
jgi:glycerol-3-phosphate acyltransferase PlsY